MLLIQNVLRNPMMPLPSFFFVYGIDLPKITFQYMSTFGITYVG